MKEALGSSLDFPLLPGMEEGRLRSEIILGVGVACKWDTRKPGFFLF